MSNNETTAFVRGEEDFYAARGWCSAKALLARALAEDWPDSLRELLDDYSTPMADLRKEWTSRVTRGWMRPSVALTGLVAGDDDCWEEPGWYYICEREHPQAEKWTYWGR